MKKVRMLLRVSSNQQLESDGDLSVQRELVKEYVQKNSDWQLDGKEYFEGSNSGYKNAVVDRDILQEALRDAENGEYDILVAYKDDRIGRRLWDVGNYVMELKKYGVDIYTVKDGHISPESNDVTGQIMLAIRYGNSQKSSSDTGMRVKDTAKKLVQRGKFMGGKAPYGYHLELSGEISKHGRALKHLVVDEEQADVVKYIYKLAANKNLGSAKIAKILNVDPQYGKMAPNDFWRAGTITSILTNPIYAGYTAYNRREKLNGRYRKLGSEDWIMASEPDEAIVIIDEADWNAVQRSRQQRRDQYALSAENAESRTVKSSSGMLALINVLHCGYCGAKMTNGSKYNYWVIKETGEKRSGRTYIYKCPLAYQGTPHEKSMVLRADKIEPIVFSAIAEYIGKLQENDDVLEEVEENQQREKRRLKEDLAKEQQELEKIQKDIAVMEEKIPKAMTGEYTLSLEYLVKLINEKKEKEKKQQEIVNQKKARLENADVSAEEWKDLRKQIPTWQDVFLNADVYMKRTLVDKLVERIDVRADSVNIRFRINLNEIFPQSRITGGSGTILYTRGSG